MRQGEGLNDLFKAAQQEGPSGDQAREELANRPTLTSYEANFYHAWREISTTRSIGMGVGRIPFPAILKYAEYYNLSLMQSDILIRVIRAVDDAWIIATNEANAEREKSRPEQR